MNKFDQQYQDIIDTFISKMMGVDAPIPDYIDWLKSARHEIDTAIDAAQLDLDK